MNKHTVLAITMAFAIAVIAMASIPEESDAATVTLDSETIGNYLNEETQQYEFSEGDYVLGEKFGLYDNQITHPMVFSGTCTLDLNGFGIFPTENVQYGIINQGVLTVKDSSEDKSGSIALSYSSGDGVAILNEGSLIVDGGSFSADYGIMNSASHTDTELVVNDVWALTSTQAIRVCSGTVEINGGDITDGHDYGIAIIGDASEGSISVEVNGGDISASSGAAILVQGSNDSERPVKLVFNDGSISVNNCLGISGNGAYDYTDITINGGSIESQNQVAVFNPQIGDLTVTGGTITGYTGIQFCGSGLLTIDGGTITGTGECKPMEKVQTDGTFDDGAAVSLITRGNGYQDDGAGISVRINGGTFESMEAAAIQSYKMAYSDSSWHTGSESGLDTALDTVDIRGGKFTSPDGTKPISYDSDDESTGIYSISGGTYSADVDSTLIDPAYMMSGGILQPNPEAYVAQNGDRYYISLQAAVEDAAEDDTIVMTVDELTLAGTLTVPKGITIDLGGGTLILAADGDSPGGIKFTSGESTIRNGTIQDPRSDGNPSSGLHTVEVSGKGTILNVSNVDFEVTVPQSTNSYNYALFISGGSTLKLDGSSISEVDQTGESWFDKTWGVTGVAVIGPGQNAGYVTTLAVTDTTIETRGFAIAGNGNETSYGTSITLGQGTVINTVYAAVYHPHEGELIVDGASITGRTGIEIRAGSLEIREGSSVTSTGHFTSTPNGSGVTTIGAAVAVVQHTTKQPIEVTITGGTFQGERAFFEANKQNNVPLEGVEIEISGGTFTGTNGGLSVECLDIGTIGPFITGGTFNTDVTPYMPEGMGTETNPDGSVTVTAPVRFDVDSISVFSDSFRLPVTIAQGATVAYQLPEGFTIEGDLVTIPDSFSGDTFTITATSTVAGVDYTATLTVAVQDVEIASEESGVELIIVSSAESMGEFMERYDEMVGVPDGVSIESDWLIIDVSRVDGLTDPVPFAITVPGLSETDGVAFYAAHFGITVDNPECVIEGDRLIITPSSFSTFAIVPYLVSVDPDPEPTPDPDPGWNPGLDDDDDYVPPIYVPSDTSSSDDDTVKIVACAAAAVVAAIMAAFLILGHRRE